MSVPNETGVLTPEPVGSYHYEKDGRSHLVTVFALAVTDVKDVWPERFLRRREWVEPDQALERIEEEGLKTIVRRHFDKVILLILLTSLLPTIIEIVKARRGSARAHKASGE